MRLNVFPGLVMAPNAGSLFCPGAIKKTSRKRVWRYSLIISDLSYICKVVKQNHPKKSNFPRSYFLNFLPRSFKTMTINRTIKTSPIWEWETAAAVRCSHCETILRHDISPFLMFLISRRNLRCFVCWFYPIRELKCSHIRNRICLTNWPRRPGKPDLIETFVEIFW